MWLEFRRVLFRSSKDLALIGAKFGLSGQSHLHVNAALEAAKKNAKDADLIIVTGSTFVIADLELWKI